jgi:hypothetical protein
MGLSEAKVEVKSEVSVVYVDPDRNPVKDLDSVSVVSDRPVERPIDAESVVE